MHVIEGSCQHGQPQWQQLRGLLGTAIYGGVIDNAHDFQARPNTPCGYHKDCVQENFHLLMVVPLCTCSPLPPAIQQYRVQSSAHMHAHLTVLFQVLEAAR